MQDLESNQRSKPLLSQLLKLGSSYRRSISFRKPFLGIIIFVALLASVVGSLGLVLPSPTAHAAAGGAPDPDKTATLTPEKQAQSFAYYQALRFCETQGWYSASIYVGPTIIGSPGTATRKDNLSIDNATGWQWYNQYLITGAGLANQYQGFLQNNSVLLGVINESNVSDTGEVSGGDSAISCNAGSSWIKTLAGLWGYSKPADMLCAIGFTRSANNGVDCNVLGSPPNDFNAPPYAQNVLDSFWTGKLGNKGTTIDSSGDNNQSGTGGREYALYYQSFKTECVTDASKGGSTYMGVPDWTNWDGNIGNNDPVTNNYGYASTTKDQNFNVQLYNNPTTFTPVTKTCNELYKLIIDLSSSFAKSYMAYLKAHKDPDITPGCTGTNCNTTTTPTTTCVIEGIGWIICPVVLWIAGVTDAIYHIIELLLVTPPISTDTSSSNAIYNVWTIMRNFANIAFVILFLIIIFSQLTGAGVTNYGIKKTLPRLVIAAILVNLSYWISAIAVDVSNILGSGLFDLLTRVSGHTGLDFSSNWGNILTSLLSGALFTANAAGVVAVGTVAAAIVGGTSVLLPLLYLAIPLLLTAILAVLVAAFILIARQALIVILIIVSPLAFVAMLLPNTSKLFTKWRQYLTTLLLMYPIFSLIFGGAQIAGLTMMASAATPGSTGIDTSSPILAGIPIVAGQAIMVLPFFFLPFMISKFGGGNLDNIAANISRRGKTMFGGVSNAAKKEGKARMGRAYEDAKYGNPVKYNKKGKETISSILRRRSGVGSVFRSGTQTYDQYRDRLGMEDKTLATLRQKTTNTRLADDSGLPSSYATKAAGGNVEEGRAMGDQARAAAEAEIRQKAIQALQREVATIPPADVGVKLIARSIDMTKTAGEREAAVHLAAAQGNDKALDSMQQHVDANPNTPESEVLQRHIREAVSANKSALIDKAPHLIKGEDAAFTSMTAERLTALSPTTMKAYMSYIAKQRTNAAMTATTPDELEMKAEATKNLQAAIGGLNSSIENAQTNVVLQGKFDNNAGLALIREATAQLGGPGKSTAWMNSNIGATLQGIDTTSGKIIPK